eukprot:6215312-Prymnesium_polylepis.1
MLQRGCARGSRTSVLGCEVDGMLTWDGEGDAEEHNVTPHALPISKSATLDTNRPPTFSKMMP